MPFDVPYNRPRILAPRRCSLQKNARASNQWPIAGLVDAASETSASANHGHSPHFRIQMIDSAAGSDHAHRGRSLSRVCLMQEQFSRCSRQALRESGGRMSMWSSCNVALGRGDDPVRGIREV